ncbi:MAG: c-type cytochrome [Gemmatimonadaceae bacterium]
MPRLTRSRSDSTAWHTRVPLVLAFIAVWPAPARTQSAPLSAYSTHKAVTLLRTQLACLGCHTLDGEGGNIGPDLTTVRERRTPAYIAAMVSDPQRVVPGSAMPRPLLPAPQRALIIQYLSQGPARTPAPESPVPAPNVTVPPADGRALYGRWCASCHGSSGNGDGPNAKRLPVAPAAHASKEAMERRPDDSLYDTIAGGGAIMNRSPRMPAFGGTLSANEIRALVAYIRQLCRCQGPAWSRDGTPP